jgi:hypothetical protein
MCRARVFYKSNAVLCWMNFHLSANALELFRMQCTAAARFHCSEDRHFACKPEINSARYCFRVENLEPRSYHGDQNRVLPRTTYIRLARDPVKEAQPRQTSTLITPYRRTRSQLAKYGSIPKLASERRPREPICPPHFVGV